MTGVVDYPTLRRRPSKPGLALVGDAALSVEPLSAAGCGWALQTAEWLAEWVTGALREPPAPGATLRASLRGYANRISWKLDGHHLFVKSVAAGRRLNLLEQLTFAAAARDPVCADNLLAFESRCIGVSKFLRPSAVGRALWVNARHAYATRGGAPAPLP